MSSAAQSAAKTGSSAEISATRIGGRIFCAQVWMPRPRSAPATMPSRSRPPRMQRSCARPAWLAAMKPASSAEAIAMRTATSKSGEAAAFPSSPRMMAKLLPHTAMISVSARSANEEEPQPENGVDGEEECALQPVGLAVEGDQRQRDHRDAQRHHLESGEGEVHRGAEEDADDHQQRSDEQR